MDTMTSLDTKTSFTYEDCQHVAQSLLQRVTCRPQLGIICGSGLGGLADVVQDVEVIPYSQIPGFPTSTVAGHDGQLVFGTLQGKAVILMKGRGHVYEGNSIEKVALPVRTMRLMGVTTLIVTNACGGINTNFNAGDVVVIKDHVSLPGMVGVNPLMGPNDERFGVRFPAMTAAYDVELRKLAKTTAEDLGFGPFIREGVYCMSTGPCYETVTETLFLRMMGADVIGMSTVPEVMAAVHCGMRVLAISLVTNMTVQEYDSTVKTTHEEVLEMGRTRSNNMQSLISAIVDKIDLE